MTWKCQHKNGCDFDALDNSNFCKEHKKVPQVIQKIFVGASSLGAFNQLMNQEQVRLSAQLRDLTVVITTEGEKAIEAIFEIYVSSEDIGKVELVEDKNSPSEVLVKNRLVRVKIKLLSR